MLTIALIILSGAAKDVSAQFANPVLTAATPDMVQAGSPAVPVTISGTNFLTSSVVRWNGFDRPTIFINATTLSVNIPAADFAVAGTANLTVFNPPPQGGPTGSTSNALTFAVIESVPLTPVITSINPNSANAGSQAFV